MTDTADDVSQTNDLNKYSNPSMFHKIYCKTGTNPIGMTRDALKQNVSVGTTNKNKQ